MSAGVKPVSYLLKGSMTKGSPESTGNRLEIMTNKSREDTA